MTETIKVLITDDHPVVRDSVRLAIMDKPDMNSLERQETDLKLRKRH